MTPTPLVALCGFLGSGKTTILRRWRGDEDLRGAAVIVHDFSDFGLDAELLAGDESIPLPGKLVDRMAALHGRHAREDLHPSVGTALNEISDLTPPPPVVLCESTGAARPWPLIQALTQDARFALRHFIVTVDALNLHRDFDDGKALTSEGTPSPDPALQHAAEVLAEQLAFASIVILTKVDLLQKDSVNAQVKLLQEIQPNAAIGLSAHAGLQLPQLDDIPAPDLDTLKQRAESLGLTRQSATSDDITSVVLKDSRPFHPLRLHEACQSKLGTGLYRTKGFLWLASRPGDVLLWQQSGSQIALELTGTWRAEIVRNQGGHLAPEEIDALQAILDAQDSMFGDRHNELTLIGLKPAVDAFRAALEEALCTDEEIDAWQQGKTFTDPWPTNVKRVGADS